MVININLPPIEVISSVILNFEGTAKNLESWGIRPMSFKKIGAEEIQKILSPTILHRFARSWNAIV